MDTLAVATGTGTVALYTTTSNRLDSVGLGLLGV